MTAELLPPVYCKSSNLSTFKASMGLSPHIVSCFIPTVD